jgi:hypothetical protein
MRKAHATSLRRTKISGRILVSPFHLQGTRANAMAEFRSGLLLDVGFETLPIVLGGVYFVTIGTNGNQLFELMNLSRKPKNSIRDAQSHPNCDGVKRLRKEIVNAGFSARS